MQKRKNQWWYHDSLGEHKELGGAGEGGGSDKTIEAV